jgi:CRISPR/Cas system-associated protein Cas10 (large subunit of type III CRISPR-Cas system)
MRVGNLDIHLHNLVDQIKARKMAKRSRTPTCTHLSMDCVYGQQQRCHVCGRPPSIGFLYECRQDCDAQSLHNLILKGDEKENHVEDTKSDMRLQLEWLGLSESIIITAELGDYTPVQLEKLKSQKKDLRQIISDTLQVTHINNAVVNLAAIAQTPSSYDGTLNSTMSKDRVSRQQSPIKHPWSYPSDE